MPPSDPPPPAPPSPRSPSAPPPRPGLFRDGDGRAAVVGHRGARRVAPENTLESFRAAARLGAGWVELDVRLAGDGVAVVVHDPELPDGGVVAQLDTAELALRGVPGLADVLGGLPVDLGVDIEIKHRSGEEHSPDAPTLAAATLHALGPVSAHRDVVVTSFSTEVLTAVGAQAPELPRGLLTLVLQPFGGAVERAVELGCRVVAPHFSAPGLSTEGIDEAHAAGLEVMVWTVNSPRRARRLVEAGVDAVCTDRVERTVAVLAEVTDVTTERS